MAHQLRNPMQAISVNLEVVRTKVGREAPELWEGLERFAAAADENVRLLSRRLDLLLAAARRDGEAPSAADPVRLARELVGALRLDREPPAVRVETGEGLGDAGVRCGRGALVVLLLRLLDAARAADSGEEETEVRFLPGEEGGTLIEADLSAGPAPGEPDWAALADAAGGRAATETVGRARRLRVRLPPA